MHAYVKSYLTFFAFMAITAIVVKPVLKSINVPLLSDIVS